MIVSRLEIEGHAVGFILKLGSGDCLFIHEIAIIVVNEQRQTVDLLWKSVSPLHVVVIYEAEPDTMGARVKVFVQTLARRESKAHRCDAAHRTYKPG